MKRQSFVRLDAGSIGDDGIFRARGRVARIGTQKYPDGVDLRLDADVIASVPLYDRKPITIDHNGGFVNSENKDDLVKGFVSSAEYTDGWVMVELAVHAQDAIDLITTSHQYFSVGYEVDLEDSAGEWVDSLGIQGSAGETYRYDSIQRNMRINHVTITGNPRAGVGAKVCDSIKSNLDAEYKISHVDKLNTHMPKINHGGLSYTLEGADADNLIQIFNELNAQVQSANETITASESLLTEVQDSLNEVTTKLDASEAKVVALTSDLTTARTDSEKRLDSDKVAELVATEATARLDAWEVAKKVLKSDSFDASKSVADIRKEVLAQAYPHSAEKLDSASPGYIDALWDELNHRLDNSEVLESNEIKESFKKSDSTSSSDTLSAARQAYLNKRTNRGQN